MTNNIKYDVCVIGSGIAGITLSLELAEQGLKILLIESGGYKTSINAQILSDAILLNPDNHSLMSQAVYRGLGGTSNIWGGRCVPFDNFDFIIKDNIQMSGWPFSYDTLNSYYTKACEILGVGKPNFDASKISNNKIKPLTEFFNKNNDLTSDSLERWCPEPNIWKLHRKSIESNPFITVLTDYTCVGFIQFENSEVVEAALIKPTTNRKASQSIIYADNFVIACGGIESTRLVLNSMSEKNGLKPKSRHLVGKYYMGHPSGKIAEIELNGDPSKTIYGFDIDQNIFVRRRIKLSDKIMIDNNLLNISFWFDNPPISDWRHKSGILSSAYLALTTPIVSNLLAPAAIRKRITGSLPLNRREHFLNCINSPLKTIKFSLFFLYQRFITKPRIPGFFTFSSDNKYYLHYHAEQAPNFFSQITLTNAVDDLGMKRASIDLQWSIKDINSIINAHKILDDILRRNNIGKLNYRFDFSEMEFAVKSQAVDGFHQIGTLRMADSPENGVTDPFGKIFGTSNCYVASSAIFPTSGEANPSLTIAAIAIRQAEYIANNILGKNKKQ